MSTALDFTYQYQHPSELVRGREGARLELATCNASKEHPHFFEGRVRQPKTVGDMLVALTDVVRTHYFMPRPVNLDPVVTSNDEMLRFEGFSGCCGVYARVDLPESTFERERHDRGTTNVDFNEPMRSALTRLRDQDDVRLAVGRDGVRLSRAKESIVEKKVKLPLRWIKGFSEVQAYQPRLSLSLEVPGAEARRFVRSLPLRNPPKRPSWVTQSGRALRLTQRESRGAIPLAGVHRLRALEPLVHRARRLRIWSDAEAGTTTWEVELDAGHFSLMLSPEVYRGFSGEGQVLETLARGDWETSLSQVRAQLKWQNQIDPELVAKDTGLAASVVEDALAVLGARGLAGHDARLGRYFHRELPFDLDKVEELQPRLKNARALVESGAVTLLATPGEVEVVGKGAMHHVRLHTDGDRCSCRWFSKHKGGRGPCKHILAARLRVEAEPS